MKPGHVFVVHSRLQDLQYDATLIPTDRPLSVRSYWRPVLNVPALPGDVGHLDVSAIRPASWPRPFARIAPTGDQGPTAPTWFIDTTSGGSDPGQRVDRVMANLAGALREIVASGISPGTGRAIPLIAVPTLGVRGGGLNSKRGLIVRRLLEQCQSFVLANAVDIVIAAANASDYAAFQHQRRHGNHAFLSLSVDLQQHGTKLAGLARDGHLALFLGAGVSIPAGLPSWSGLLDDLRMESHTSQDELESLRSPLDQAELLQRRLGGSQLLKEKIAERFQGGNRPGISHLQLAALGCSEVITTNYDSLFETAVNLKREDGSRMAVLPYEQKKPFQDWILKMHGDLSHPGKVVLSRSDFVGYSASSGPIGAIVQALMLTKHLLVVGTSLTDDNFLRLAYEVRNYLRNNPPAEGAEAGEIGTVLDLQTDSAKKALWDGTFNVLGVAEPGVSREDQARQLSIMLDFIAMRAARPDWLLDPRYDDLLTPQEARVADDARRLCGSLAGLVEEDDDNGWSRLASLLTGMGATNH